MNRARLFVVLLCAGALLPGCGKKTEDQKKGPPSALITAAKAKTHPIQITQKSIGIVDTESAPTVSAEVAGRIIKIMADVGEAVKAGQTLAVLDTQDLVNSKNMSQAEVQRIQALLANQQQVTDRNRELSKQNFISPTKLDESQAQLTALRQQLSAAQAQLANAGHNLNRGNVTAPVGGRIEQKMVSTGDYVSVGKPMFQLATTDKLRVRLPFPETVSDQIKRGQRVRLTTATAVDRVVEGKVAEIRPMIGASNRAFEVIIEIANPGGWKPGSSVNGAIIIVEHPQAVVVPETSVVLRPAGKVIYVIKDGRATQRVVETGADQDGWQEITSGLAAGEVVAVDGAGFLTDKAAVNVQGGIQ